MAQDPRHFLISTDYPMPVIVYQGSSNTSVPSYEIKTVTIKHNLGFVPLLMGQWSTNSNFQPSQDLANEIDWQYMYDGSNDMVSCFFDSDSTNIYVDAQNMSSSSKTFYWRIFAYAPPDYTGETPNVTDTTHFIFNSEFNYPKIAFQGVTGNVSYGSETTISHNLGYVPQVRIWQQENGRVRPCFGIYSPDLSGNRGGPRVTSSSLIIKNLSLDSNNYTRKYYYHIYGDAA